MSLSTSLDGATLETRWREYLRDAPPPAFPRLQNASAAPTPGAIIRRKIRLPRALSVEHSQALVQIAWCLVNVYYTDAADVIIGLLALGGGKDDGKTPEDSEERAMAATPFRFHMEPDQTIAACLDAVLHHGQDLARRPFGMDGSSNLGPDLTNAANFGNQLIIHGGANAADTDMEIPLDRAINLECTVARGRATTQVFYDDAIINRIDMERVVGTFEHLLQQLADPASLDPANNRTLGDINPASSEDVAQVANWNEHVPPAVDDCMHHMVERMAQQRPSAEAVCADALGLSLSYQQLNDMADKLALHLVEKGAGPGRIVPFMFEKSPWVIPSLLAINKAGAAFAPLDPAHQWQDTQGLLQACEATFVLCSPTHQSRFAEHGVDAVVVDPALFDSLPSPDGTVSVTQARPADPGYVIFTSGSSGTPKGVICSHSAWCTNTAAHGPREFHSTETRLLQFSAYTFDISITDMFTTLAFGGTVCVPSEHERLNDVAGAINRMRVNHAALTPTVARFLRPKGVPTLKVLITGGEEMPEEIMSLWVGLSRLINSYGPAECTSRVACSLKSAGDIASHIGTRMGAALWVTRSHDPTRLVPIGAVGELLVEGNILGDGYLKDEEKTNAAFIAAPEWLRGLYPERAENTRLYRTGDLVQQRPDGSFIFMGRRDAQIKVHGVRLEAGHIEAKIRGELPEDASLVVDKVTIAGDDDGQVKQTLAAFIQLPNSTMPENGTDMQLVPADAAIRDFVFNLRRTLLAALPSYMVPSHILVVNTIPLGATAKVNRRALQTFARNLSAEQLREFTGSVASAVSDGTEIEKPYTEAEAALSKLWAKVLGVDSASIGRQDSFLGLGGDSVSCMKLVSEGAAAGLRFSVADVFQCSTLAELGQLVSDGTEGGKAGTTPSFVPEPMEPFELVGGLSGFFALRGDLRKQYKLAANRVDDVLPATPMQEGLMAETVAHPEAYILQEVLKLSKDVDTDMLLDALTTLVETYPILRTCIVRLKEHGTCQVVLSESEPVEVGLFSDDLPAFLARDKKQHMGYGDPLSRFALVSDPAGEQYLVWTSHHAITDGHMHQLMLQSLERAYDNDGFEASPEAVGFNQFAKYCADPDNKAASLDHWRSEFAGFDGSHYPSCADTYEPLIDKYVSHSISLPLEQARSPVTPAILLRAAWMMVLSQANNSSELVMGVTQSGRDVDLPGIHECMGPCLATMPIRGGIEGTEALSFSQYLAKVQRQYVDAIPHQHVGLQHIRKASDECANAVGFRNLLVVQPSFANDSKLATPVLDARNAGDQLNFGLLLECTLAAGEIDIRAGFDSSLLSENEIALLMQRLEHVHSQLGKADNGALPLSSLDMVSPLDLQILESFNPDIPPLNKCLHWMIEEQAQRQPDALMVDAWDARLTYHEANEYSDRLAGVLVELGVGPEIMVPFAFEKSAWATVAIHAILKAGGACVGVDMAHPRERHQRIMEDTEAVVVVASTAYAGNLEGLGVKHIVAVDRAMLDRLPPRQPAGPDVVAVSPNNPAWVVYSSGSTGTPKGSVLEHRSLCATSRTNSEILGVGPTTRAIHFASYAFDVAIEENVIIPMYGGCVCIPSDEQRLSNLPGVMQTMEINWADLTPTVARLLSPENAPFIRTLVLGGESLTKDIIDTWAGIDNIKLFNTYGPSECSIQCTSSKALGRVATGANIGRPVNCKLWVVDADNPHRLLPVGATGELLIEGHIVGRGYLNQAAKTEAAFIQGLPWATADGDVDGLLRRFYRTGDLAKFNHDGTLDCLGRQDSQIKLHGQRIELGEIEYNITKRLAVPDAAQVAVEAFSPGGSSRKLLAAFIQFAETDSAYSADETPRSSPSGLDVMEMHDALRKELLRIKSETAQHLPVYMIPSLIIPLHLMPTNTSGKIDRKKLREEAGKFDPRRLALYSLSETVQLAARETESRAQVQVQTSFSSPAERALAGLWAETMGIDLAETPIGPDDSFLELGGDSITAMQLVGKAMSAGLGLSVSRILKAPTLRDMAAAAVVTDERALLALEAPELSESESEPEVSFSSPAERALAGLWAETMGIDLAETPIGPDDSFLELGGDSITAMQLVGKATAAGLGLSVSHILRAPKLRDMAVAAVVSDERALLAFEAPGLSPVAVPPPLPTISVNDFTQLLTINTAVPSDPVSTGSNSPWMTPPETPFTDLAYFPFQLISTKASVADVLTMVATKCNLDRELVQDVYPATPLQEGMMALTADKSDSYVLRDVYELPDEGAVDRFTAAWDIVARDNAILRTRLVFVQGLGTCQVVVDEQIPWHQGNNLDDYLSKDRSNPMNYGTPLARFAIIDDGKRKLFVWTVHHALYDGYSMDMTLAAVDRAYQTNLGLTLPTLPFVEFMEYLDMINKDTLKQFWTQQLTDLETSPFPSPPPGHRCHADNTVLYSIPFSPERRTGITMATLLKAAWGILVSRLSESQDVVYGVTQSGRDLELAGIERINGPTITTVPLRMKIDGQSFVRDFLKQLQAQTVDMIPFSHVGLQNIKNMGAGNAAAQAACDFQNLLVIQPREEEQESALFKKNTSATTANYLSGYGLVVECALGSGEIVFSAHHDSSVISSAQLERVLQQLEHLLHQLQAHNGTGRIQDLDMFSPADRADLVAWNSNFPRVVNECIHDIISRSAADAPSSVAIVSSAGEITRKELDELSNHLAHQLRELGVGPDVLVPICIEKSPEAIIAMLAIQKAGGGFVPLNPTDPTERLIDLLDQVSATVVIFSEHTQHLSSALASPDNADNKISPVVLAPTLEEWGPLKTEPVVSGVNPSNLAYALFTSGSTGRPKAVLIEHSTVSSSTYGHGMAMGFSDFPRRTVQFASYTFDACIAEIFTALHFGGCICVPTEHERRNDLARFIRDFQCDWAFFTPSFVRLLQPDDVPSMKTVVLGGEALNQECIDVWADKVHLMNGYGPTETCVFAVTRTVPGQAQKPGDGKMLAKPETIGHPVSSIGWVVDPNDHHRLTPVGCVGELLIQGPSVARGYLADPEKTAEAFVRNPKWLRAFGHTNNTAQLLYKTGDLVRQDAEDGSLTYLGRKDNQTKVNGQRLELGEIETQLKSKGDNVESAVVLATKNIPSKTQAKTQQKLAAFVQFSDIEGPNSGQADKNALLMEVDDAMSTRMQDLEDAARAALPTYMVPSLWIPVTIMPTLDASGKTDRKTLAGLLGNLTAAQTAMYSLGSTTSQEEDAAGKQQAATDVEKTLVELVARILGLQPENIGRRDSFFRLGGDSITAIQLVASARTVGITLSSEAIFRQPNICDMAASAELARDGPAGVSSSRAIAPYSLVPVRKRAGLLDVVERDYGIQRSSIADLLPCTPLQEGLISLTIKDPEAYVLREIYRLPPKMDMDRFKSAWEALVQDAEVLRTRIVHLGEHGCFQVVMKQDGIPWHDAGKVQDYIDYDRAQLFEYGAPLARFALIETEHTGCYFILSMHHAVYDGWSKTLMMKHVQEAYRGISPQPSPTKLAPYNRFIEYLQRTDPSHSKKFWKTQFDGLEAQPFPRLPSVDFRAVLDSNLTIRIPWVRTAGGGQWTTATVLKAAWALVLARYTGAPDALFGAVQTGRNVPIPGVSDMIGPTITTVPMRIRVDGEIPLATFLKALQDQCTDMMRHEHMGLQNIAKISAECREACAFTNIMVIQPGKGNEAESEQDLMGATRIEDQDKGFLRFGMGLEVSLESDAIEVTGGYDRRLLSEAQMGRLLRQFQTAVLDMDKKTEAEEGALVRDVNLVSAEDVVEMAKMNETPPDDIHECTHDVVHRVAMERGGAMAVNAWDVDFQYIELDHLSTKLAHHLRALGVGPETVVPLCFEKSGWAVVAVLGVLKAGAAFVFLDPGYPIPRLNGIVRQVNASVILASLGQAPLWRGSDMPVLIIDNVSIESLPSSTYKIESNVKPSNAMYLIFTSGSTGEPKGCVIEHHSFLTCARAQAARSHMTLSSRVLQGASYSFDVSVMEMLTALTVGACVCVPNDSIRKRSVVDVINDFRITWAFLTPSIVKFIKPANIPHLKTLVLGGEALTRQNIRAWAGHVRLLNGYGPSECTIAASAHAITHPEEDPANIGKPLGGICWITDAEDHNKLAPLGAVGELVVEGSIVARGYLNKPDKTAEVFIENPTWAKQTPGKGPRRVYKTGDLAYFSTDGDIMFVGRKDAQVKVRGQRMELGEIETHLTRNKKIQHAMVAYPKGGPCKRQLVGIISFERLGATTNSNGEVMLVDPGLAESVSKEVAEMARDLSARVPSYMIPEIWVVVQSFPLLLSGKLNRKRVEQWLVSMDKATHQRICGIGASFRIQQPSTPAEQLIHQVWVDVLKLPAEEIGVTQEFTTLGGDSILAMLVMAKLKAQGGLRVTMTDVVSARTIAGLAARITRIGGDSIIGAIPPLSTKPPILADETGELFDLSPMQQFYANFALRDDYLSKQTNKHFNHTFCLAVKQGPLSADAVRSAFEALIKRHSMLRARFQRDGTVACGWRQYISSDAPGSFRFRDWENTTIKKIKPTLEEARQGLDIEKGPLMAVDLVTVNKSEQYLMVVAHHLVVDLVSWNTILGDLEEYLRNQSFSAEAPYPFSAWAKEQQQYVAKNCPPSKALPMAVPAADFKFWGMEDRVALSCDASHHTVTLSKRDTATLLTTCNKTYGAEPMDVLCSSLTHSFRYVFRNRPPPTIFRYSHGREQLDQADPSGTVGWFTTLSPIQVAVRKREDDSISVLERVIDARKSLPLNGLAYFAARYHHPAGPSAFGALDQMEVTVNYLGVSDNQQRSSGASSIFDMSNAIQGGLGGDAQEVKGFSLFSISAEVREGKLCIQCSWSKKMKRQVSIREWFYEYGNALRDVAHQVRKRTKEDRPSRWD